MRVKGRMRLLDFMPRCRLVAAIHLCFQVCRSGARCGDSRSSRQECRPRQGGGTGRTRHRIPRGGTALSRRGPSCQPRAVFDRGAPHPVPAAALRLRARRGRRARGPRSRRQAPIPAKDRARRGSRLWYRHLPKQSRAAAHQAHTIASSCAMSSGSGNRVQAEGLIAGIG